MDLIKVAEGAFGSAKEFPQFKSGDTITYREGEWDDYGYDGKAICVKLKGAWIGIYNFDHVFSVELKP